MKLNRKQKRQAERLEKRAKQIANYAAKGIPFVAYGQKVINLDTPASGV